MANSRIMLTCRHCGEQFVIGAGYVGSYTIGGGIPGFPEKFVRGLNDFYQKHEHGDCTMGGTDFSDDAKNHFAILEEGDDPKLAMSPWISVKERLPEDEVDVLCHDKEGTYVAWHTSEIGWTDGEFTELDVTHWMPLPEPPEEAPHA